MRDDTGHLAEGISVTDMGSKTVANDLDNARITFHNFKVPSDALLAATAMSTKMASTSSEAKSACVSKSLASDCSQADLLSLRWRATE